MDLSKVYCKSEQFVDKGIGNETVLVPLTDNVADMNHVLTLNEVGTFLFNQIDGKKSMEEILLLLLKEYDVDRDIAINDIEHFITDTVSNKVIYKKQ